MGSGSSTGSATSAYSSRPSKTLARLSRSGSSSASGPGSGSKRATGTTSSTAPSRAPMTSTCDSASRAIGNVASGLLPAAISRTVRGTSGRRPRTPRPARSSRQTSSSLRPSNARPRVTSSAYSRSPPTGRPGREAGDAQPEDLEQPGQVGGGGLALEVGVGRDDHLGDDAVAEPGEQLAHAQVVGADAVDRADRAAEHVVAAAELAGALDGDDVLGLLDDADRRARRGAGRGRSGTGRPRRR